MRTKYACNAHCVNIPTNPKKEKLPKISFHVDADVKEEFEQWCQARDLDMSTVLRGWIDNRSAIGVWIRQSQRS